MSTSKKDYVAIAQIFRAEIERVQADTVYNAAERAVGVVAVQRAGLNLADYFTESNPRFDRRRFLVASGV